MSQKVKLVEIERREIKVSRKNKHVYHNGSDNDYPDRIEGIINNSVTAKLCVNKMRQFLIGKGININNDMAVSSSGKTVFNLLCDIATDVPYQKSFAVHVNYNIENKVSTASVIQSKKVRVSKEDLFENTGLIWYSDDWSGSNMSRKKNNKRFYYPFNPDSRAITAQRDKDFKLYIEQENIKLSSLSVEQIAELKMQVYRGQILYVNMDNNDIYANAYIDPSYNDADTEYRISNFRNNQIRSGFIGTSIFTVLDQGDEGEELVTDEQIKGLMGSDNSHKALKVSASANAAGDLAEVIRTESIKTEINPEMFEYDETKVQENILNCFNNIPKILVRSSDASLFGNSGEALRVAQEIYNDETSYERDVIEENLNKIFKHWVKPFQVKIINILGSNQESQAERPSGSEEETPEQLNAKSQATLRGSVGGVTALLQIQQSVSSRVTDLEAGINIIVNIYGFTREEAAAMLGTPKLEGNGING